MSARVNHPAADRPYHRPAIPLTLALVVGIVLSQGSPGIAAPVLILLLATLVWLVVRLRKRQSARWSPLLAAAATGYLAMVPWISPAHGPDHITHYLDRGSWRVRGVVTDRPVERLGRTRVVLKIEALSREAWSQAVRGRIRLTVMGTVALALAPGDRVAFTASLRSFRNFKNPGGFDYQRYMAFSGIHGSAWVPAEKLHRIGRSGRQPTWRSIQHFRHRLGRLIDRAGEDSLSDEKAVLKALVFGERSEIDEDLRQRFNRAGVGHLLAISGLHVGIVASLAFSGWCWLFSFVSPLLWRGWGRQWAAVVTLVPVLTYGILAGMSPSTQRAEVMVTVFLIALILGRSHDMLNTLAVAALVILTVSPPALFSISFQLSFAAVLAIVYGLGKIGITPDRDASMANKVARRLTAFMLVSALAIAGTAPVVLFHFNQTSLVGIAANLLLVPLVGFVAVPVGLVSAFAAFVFEPVASLGFTLSLNILRLAMVGLDWFAALPFAAIHTVTPSLLEIGLYYLGGWALFNLRQTPPARWVLVAVLVVAIGDGLYWSHRRFWHDDLKVTAIDVGQGGATLMELPGGKVVLYDGGGFSDNRSFDMGRRVVAPLLWRRKIATVDILVLSHPNADHLNGLIFVADHFNVQELWTGGDTHTSMGYRALMAVCRARAINVRQLDAAAGPITFGRLTLDILHPPPGYFSATDGIDQQKRNNGSLVVQASLGQTAFLLTGDIMARAEGQMVQRAGKYLASTVLFAPHHGSNTSSSAAFIDAVNPKVVVISAGAGNRFGFPHPRVMARYRQAGCRILITGINGAICMRSDGRSVSVTPFSEGQ